MDKNQIKQSYAGALLKVLGVDDPSQLNDEQMQQVSEKVNSLSDDELNAFAQSKEPLEFVAQSLKQQSEVAIQKKGGYLNKLKKDKPSSCSCGCKLSYEDGGKVGKCSCCGKQHKSPMKHAEGGNIQKLRDGNVVGWSNNKLKTTNPYNWEVGLRQKMNNEIVRRAEAQTNVINSPAFGKTVTTPSTHPVISTRGTKSNPINLNQVTVVGKKPIGNRIEKQLTAEQQKVWDWQGRHGLKQDGKWGSKTQAVYDSMKKLPMLGNGAGNNLMKNGLGISGVPTTPVIVNMETDANNSNWGVIPQSTSTEVSLSPQQTQARQQAAEFSSAQNPLSAIANTLNKYKNMKFLRNGGDIKKAQTGTKVTKKPIPSRDEKIQKHRDLEKKYLDSDGESFTPSEKKSNTKSTEKTPNVPLKKEKGGEVKKRVETKKLLVKKK